LRAALAGSRSTLDRQPGREHPVDDALAAGWSSVTPSSCIRVPTVRGRSARLVTVTIRLTTLVAATCNRK
jgi:hypothetical protein